MTYILAESLMGACMTCINKGTAETRTSDGFQTVLIDVNLKSDMFCGFCRSRSHENTIHKNNLHHSNLTFSGVLRGTKVGHVEGCVNS